MVALAIRDACAAAAYSVEASASPKTAAQLIYLAVYSCGLRARADVEACARREYVSMDSVFCRDLTRQVPDRQTEGGWTVTDVRAGRVLLEQAGVRAYAPASAFAAEPSRGDVPAISVPALRPGRVPGFVVRTCADRSAFDAVSRLYLNLAPEAAAWATGELSRRLDAAGVRHDVKVLAHPAAYDRADACVLYVRSDDAPRTIEVVRREAAAAGVSLRDRTPLLTLEVAPGLGFADEPSDVAPGRSHGQWVTGLLLEAATQTRVPEAVEAHVLAGIRRAGRDPLRPFLRGGRGAAWPALEQACARAAPPAAEDGRAVGA